MGGSAERPSIDGLIPLKITGRHYGDNLARLDLLFSSLEHFVADGLLGELIVVARDDEIELIEQHLRNWHSLPLRLVTEGPLLPEFQRFTKPWQLRPWQRQQIIKLAAPAITSADFVLVLDPDVLAVKPITETALFANGRALLEPEARSVHRQWWLDSADLLGVSPGLDRPGMNVTPALLSTAILAEVHRRLEAAGHRRWVEVLLTAYCDWTEYTLYLLTAEASGLLDRHHLWADAAEAPAHLHVDPQLSIWSAEAVTAEAIARCFTAEDPGLFAVVQSKPGVSVTEVADAVAGQIPVHVHPAVAPPPVAKSRSTERLHTAARLAAQRIYRTRRRVRALRKRPRTAGEPAG